MSTDAEHVIVLCHGIGGNHQELAYLERKIAERSVGRRVFVLNSKENAIDLANLGIMTCAEKLAKEIKEEVAKYPDLKRISLVGMSLGGLIQR
jgi:esterase/lipase